MSSSSQEEDKKKMEVEEETEDGNYDPDSEMMPQDPLLTISSKAFLLTLKDQIVPKKEKEDIKKEVLSMIEENGMSNYYTHLCKKLGWTADKALSLSLQAKNEKEKEMIEKKIAFATKEEGETEVTAANLMMASFLSRIGDKEKATTTYTQVLGKMVGVGGRIDVVFALIRIAIAFEDLKMAKTNIDKAHTMVEDGGDWERRNRLGLYKATYFIMMREFAKASPFLVKGTSTFTCTELYSYNQFVVYTLIVAVVTLKRVDFQKDILKAPEILGVLDDVPFARELIFSLHQCQYKRFLHALSGISDTMKRDVYLSRHLGYLLREIRVVVYKQFLTPYLSVTLQTMADTFGVSVDFIGAELSRFIAASRLNCKIDKVKGVIVATKADIRSSQYQDVLKEGDLLLNQIQKVAKALDV